MALSTPLGIKFAQTIATSSRDKLLKATRPTHFSLEKLFSSKASGDACTIEDGGNPITGNTKHENRRIRRNLALAYRLLNRLELNEGVCNHLTAMAPCQTSNSKQTMLVIPGSMSKKPLQISDNFLLLLTMDFKKLFYICHLGHLPNGGASQHWAEVTASSLIGVDEDGNVIENGNLGGEPELSAKCIHLGIRKVRPDAKVS